MVLKYAALAMLLAAVFIGIRAMYEDLSEWWLRRIHTYASWLTMEFESMFEAMTCSSSSRAPRREASEAIRLNTLRRGRTASMTPDPSTATSAISRS